MSKEMKTVEQHWLLSAAIQKATNISRIQCRPKGSDPRGHWCGILVGEINRLNEENAALRDIVTRLISSGVAYQNLEEMDIDSDDVASIEAKFNDELIRADKLITELGDSNE